MKNLLILTTSESDKKLQLVNSLKETLNKTANVELGLFDDIVFELDKGKVNVFLKNRDITEFDLIYFRKVGKISLAGTLAICLQNLGVRFFDTSFKEIGPVGNKLTSLTKLAWADLPIIPTFFCSNSQLINYKEKIIKKFGFPIVAKDLNLQRGEGVSLLKNETDFDNLSSDNADKQLLLQKFIVSDEEYRILVLNNKVGVYEQKIRTDKDEFRSNAALGAEEKFMPINEISDEMKEISLKASKALLLEIAGVDVMVEKSSSKLWLIEVNRGPGISYEIVPSVELAAVGEFFKEELS
ncbi:RimK family alpha-L-glutamate ligase [soil metagenome]